MTTAPNSDDLPTPEQNSHLDILNATTATRYFLPRTLGKIWALTALVARRLFYYPGLSILALVGIILAVGLVTSAGFFAQAVDKVMLTREMAEYTRVTNRPPFAPRVYTFSSREIPLTMDRVDQLRTNVADTISSEVNLPVRYVNTMVDSGVLQLTLQQPGAANSSQGSSGLPLGQKSSGTVQTTRQEVNLIQIPKVADYMEILDGEPLLELADNEASSDLLDVWMHIDMVDTMGVQINEPITVGPKDNPTAIQARLAGIWQPIDDDDPFWPGKPGQVLASEFLVRRADYMNLVEPYLEMKVRAVTWLVVLDENAVVPSRARQYAEGFERAEAVILKYLPDARVTLPSVSLGKFVDRQTTLTTLLLGFNVPALGFLLYFLVLTSTVIAFWQRRETTILVRRGMNQLEIISMTLLEGLLLFLIGAPIGLGFGILLARMMGYSTSFLNFTARDPLPVSIYGINFTLLLATLAVVLITKLWTAGSVDRRNLVSQERDHVRPPQGPFWYRTYLDLLLLIPAFYGYRQLTLRGSLSGLVEDSAADLFSDPLLIVLPALFVVAIALLSMRVFALLMNLIDRLSNRIDWIPLHLALRQLGRHSHTYINPLLMVIVSLGLGIYTVSMAASLDQWLVDRMYHQAGADFSFKPYLEAELLKTGGGSQSTGGGSGLEQANVLAGNWIPWVNEYEKLPGVAAAARVGDYEGNINLATGGRIEGRFIAVDRHEFGDVAWSRRDFANESMGALMNRLAAFPEGILVSQKFYEQQALSVDDLIEIQVITAYGATVTDQFTIVGVYTYFPTVYEDEVAVIGNLEHLFSYFGQTMYHHIWLRAESGGTELGGTELGGIGSSGAGLGAESGAYNVSGFATETDGNGPIIEVISETGVNSIGELNVAEMVSAEQAKMERVGVFGTLSVSFLAATVMAALGLLTYSYASLQERRFHFAILRAGGMGSGEIIGQVALEYLILTVFGAIAGILIGSWTAQLFVPMFRIANEGRLAMPPLVPIIAQREIIPLALGFAATMIVLEVILIGAALYRRMFDALRVGM